MARVGNGIWPWIAGLAVGAAVGLFYLGLSPAVAHEDDVVTFDVDLNKGFSQSDLQELMQVVEENPGRDIVLEPMAGFLVPDGEDRRSRDEARAAAEDLEMERHVAEKLADGTYVTGDEELPGCAAQALLKASAGPARQLMCNGRVVAAPSKLSFERAYTKSGVEGLLRLRLEDLLDGVDVTEKTMGFSSHFSNSGALRSLDLRSEGAVEVDFHSIIGDQVAELHTGYATHTMLDQIYRTLFQFRDVSSVRLTVDGSCEAFGDMIGGPCQDVDRALWEQMQWENRRVVPYFNLKARR